MELHNDFSNVHPTHRTKALARSTLWTQRTENFSYEDRVKIGYERSKSVMLMYQLSARDILEITPKFWDFQTDPILTMDCCVATLLTIHCNLCAGTLAMYANDRLDLQEILEGLMKFQLSGQYCLTELGHGLDIINMETTATLLPNGEFELHTPIRRAAKFMPPTSPCGIPVVSVVFARLIMDGKDYGVRSFMLELSDGERMCPGVVCKVLPPRGAARPIKHALTYFDHVRLPHSALLGPLVKKDDARTAFFRDIHRVISGGLSMGVLGISTMQISTYIAGLYGLRRTVIDASTKFPRPIITFPTQYRPVLEALSQTYVMRAFADKIRERFLAAKDNVFVQHFVSAIFKTTVMRFAQSTPLNLGDRCGAQGLMEINQMSVLHADMRGAAIAEGDILVIAIRFGMEVILGRMIPPSTHHPQSILYEHEISKIEELRHLLPSHHRSIGVEQKVLPYCQPLIEAIGHRLAYDAAVDANIDSRLVEMFVASIIRLDPAWYTEVGGLSRAEQEAKQDMVMDSLLPDLLPLLEGLNVKEYVTSPIVSDDSWREFEDELETLSSNSKLIKSRL